MSQGKTGVMELEVVTFVVNHKRNQLLFKHTVHFGIENPKGPTGSGVLQCGILYHSTDFFINLLLGPM